jgi:23S rRNA pseudouridine1911/1915/1917 synthase
VTLHHECTVPEVEQGTRLDAFIGSMGVVASRSAAVRLIEEGLVLVNGDPEAKRYAVRTGDRVEVDVPDDEAYELLAEDIPLDIRYEDEHMMVISKPVGLVVHPAQGHLTGTLVHALMHHCGELGSLQGDERPGIVHRLDKDTSGLMMVAKTDDAQATLQEAIKIRSVDRRYLTLVHGWIAPDSGLIDAPLARDSRERMRMTVSDHPDAKQSVTTFRVLERFDAGTHDDGFTFVECKLYTGRTHQIRVHMAYIKHPCVGDQLYGLGRPKADLGLTRQFLHAYSLELDHPITGERLRFVDPLPADLADRLDAIADLSTGRTVVGGEVAMRLDGSPARNETP